MHMHDFNQAIHLVLIRWIAIVMNKQCDVNQVNHLILIR